MRCDVDRSAYKPCSNKERNPHSEEKHLHHRYPGRATRGGSGKDTKGVEGDPYKKPCGRFQAMLWAMQSSRVCLVRAMDGELA